MSSSSSGTKEQIIGKKSLGVSPNKRLEMDLGINNTNIQSYYRGLLSGDKFTSPKRTSNKIVDVVSPSPLKTPVNDGKEKPNIRSILKTSDIGVSKIMVISEQNEITEQNTPCELSRKISSENLDILSKIAVGEYSGVEGPNLTQNSGRSTQLEESTNVLEGQYTSQEYKINTNKTSKKGGSSVSDGDPDSDTFYQNYEEKIRYLMKKGITNRKEVMKIMGIKDLTQIPQGKLKQKHLLILSRMKEQGLDITPFEEIYITEDEEILQEDEPPVERGLPRIDSVIESVFLDTEYDVKDEKLSIPLNPANSIASLERYPLYNTEEIGIKNNMIQGIVNEYKEQDMIQTNEMEEINQIFIDQLEVPATIILQQEETDLSNFENINDGYERLMEADRYHQLPIKLHVLDHWKNKSIEYYNKAKQLDLGAAIINYIKNEPELFATLSTINNLSDQGGRFMLDLLYKFNIFRRFQYSGGEIGAEIIEFLVEIMNDNPNWLHLVDISYCKGSPNTIACMLKLLKNNKKLFHLDISGIELSNQGVQIVCQLMENSNTLKYLNLSEIKTKSENSEELFICLRDSRSINQFEFKGNGIKSIIEAVGMAIMTNINLRHLDLSNTNITNTESIYLAECIHRSELTCIHLSFNSIDAEGKASIRTILGAANERKMYQSISPLANITPMNKLLKLQLGSVMDRGMSHPPVFITQPDNSGQVAKERKQRAAKTTRVVGTSNSYPRGEKRRGEGGVVYPQHLGPAHQLFTHNRFLQQPILNQAEFSYSKVKEGGSTNLLSDLDFYGLKHRYSALCREIVDIHMSTETLNTPKEYTKLKEQIRLKMRNDMKKQEIKESNIKQVKLQPIQANKGGISKNPGATSKIIENLRKENEYILERIPSFNYQNKEKDKEEEETEEKNKYSIWKEKTSCWICNGHQIFTIYFDSSKFDLEALEKEINCSPNNPREETESVKGSTTKNKIVKTVLSKSPGGQKGHKEFSLLHQSISSDKTIEKISGENSAIVSKFGEKGKVQRTKGKIMEEREAGNSEYFSPKLQRVNDLSDLPIQNIRIYHPSIAPQNYNFAHICNRTVPALLSTIPHSAPYSPSTVSIESSNFLARGMAEMSTESIDPTASPPEERQGVENKATIHLKTIKPGGGGGANPNILQKVNLGGRKFKVRKMKETVNMVIHRETTDLPQEAAPLELGVYLIASWNEFMPIKMDEINIDLFHYMGILPPGEHFFYFIKDSRYFCISDDYEVKPFLDSNYLLNFVNIETRDKSFKPLL